MKEEKQIERDLNEFRILCETYRKKRKHYQYLDLRQRKGIITVLWYGIPQDNISNAGYVMRSKYKMFKKTELKKEIELMENKLNEIEHEKIFK